MEMILHLLEKLVFSPHYLNGILRELCLMKMNDLL